MNKKIQQNLKTLVILGSLLASTSVFAEGTDIPDFEMPVLEDAIMWQTGNEILDNPNNVTNPPYEHMTKVEMAADAIATQAPVLATNLEEASSAALKSLHDAEGTLAANTALADATRSTMFTGAKTLADSAHDNTRAATLSHHVALNANLLRTKWRSVRDTHHHRRTTLSKDQHEPHVKSLNDQTDKLGFARLAAIFAQ